MAHPFFIIGHNPNTVEEAVEFLRRGANGLEPDIHWEPETKRFRVCHNDPKDSDPFLEDYLDGLRSALEADQKDGQRFDLAFMTFDLKPDYNYELKHLWDIIRSHFSSHFPGTIFNCTVGSEDDMHFLLNIRGEQLPNEAIGVDEGATVQQVVETFAATGMTYTYAKGISVFEFEPLDSLIGPKSFLDAVKEGIQAREAQAPRGPSLVYGWCINSVPDMKEYLRLDPPIDGILTDKTQKLYDLLTQDTEFSEKFVLAKPGENPFAKTSMSSRRANADSLH